jgi:hypothetical protein
VSFIPKFQHRPLKCQLTLKGNKKATPPRLHQIEIKKQTKFPEAKMMLPLIRIQSFPLGAEKVKARTK